MDHLAIELSLKEPRKTYSLSVFHHRFSTIRFTHNSVSQNKRQLRQFSLFFLSLETLFFTFRVFVAVTTSVNCIRLTDQAVKIKWTIVRFLWTSCSLNASNNSIISAEMSMFFVEKQNEFKIFYLLYRYKRVKVEIIDHVSSFFQRVITNDRWLKREAKFVQRFASTYQLKFSTERAERWEKQKNKTFVFLFVFNFIDELESYLHYRNERVQVLLEAKLKLVFH